MTEDRRVDPPADAKRQSPRKGLKAVLPVEDNGSFASLLNAFGHSAAVPEHEDGTTTEK